MRSDDDPPRPPADRAAVFESTISDAQQHLRVQADYLNSVNDFALRNIRLNLLLIGLVVSVLAFFVPGQMDPSADPVEPIRPFLNLGLLFAGTSAAVSIYTGFWAYSSTRAKMGVGPDDILQDIVDGNPEYVQHLNQLTKGYGSWLKSNRGLNLIDSRLLTISLVSLIMEMVYFLIAVTWGLNKSLTSTGLVATLLIVTIGLPLGGAVPIYLSKWNRK